MGGCFGELGGDRFCHGPSTSASKLRWPRDDRKNQKLAAGDGADDEEGFGAGRHFRRKQGVGRLVREIFGTGKKAQERAPLQRIVIADCAAEHGIARFEFIKHRPHCGWNGEFERDLAVHMSQRAEMRR